MSMCVQNYDFLEDLLAKMMYIRASYSQPLDLEIVRGSGSFHPSATAH